MHPNAINISVFCWSQNMHPSPKLVIILYLACLNLDWVGRMCKPF
jgi:hypothetical protein